MSLKLWTISIAKTSEVNNILWKEILSTIKLAFSDSPIRIIICNRITQYAIKEQQSQLFEKALIHQL